MNGRWFLVAILTLPPVVDGGSAGAQSFSSDAEKQAAQCVLYYTPGTQSNAAVQMIRNACNDLYNPLGLSTNSRQGYDLCLLQHLSGAQSYAASAQIAKSCADLYPRF
jgi:hypothetical protein